MLKESRIVISEAKPKDVQALIGLWKRFMTEECLAVLPAKTGSNRRVL